MRFIIKEYIEKIEIKDIFKFALDNNIDLNDNEAKILYFYLKNNWEDLLYGNPEPIILEIKNKIGEDKGNVICDLFYFYREKYKNYL